MNNNNNLNQLHAVEEKRNNPPDQFECDESNDKYPCDPVAHIPAIKEDYGKKLLSFLLFHFL